METTLTDTTVLTNVQKLSAAVAAALENAKKNLLAITVDKTYARVQASKELKALHASYVRNAEVQKNAEDKREKARDGIGEALAWKESILLDGEKKIGTLMNVPRMSLDTKRLKAEFPEIMVLLEDYKVPADCWQYRPH